jgi:hypothetical protein
MVKRADEKEKDEGTKKKKMRGSGDEKEKDEIIRQMQIPVYD